jgi:hypothetical protein
MSSLVRAVCMPPSKALQQCILSQFPCSCRTWLRRRLWQHNVNNMWAIASTTPWYRVEVRSRAEPVTTCFADDAVLETRPPMAHDAAQIEGRENLPAKDEPAVYVANHQSFLVRWPPRHSALCCLLLVRVAALRGLVELSMRTLGLRYALALSMQGMCAVADSCEPRRTFTRYFT